MSISATATALGLGWDLVNDLALDACRHLVYDDPGHLAGVGVLGVDEHVWKHTHRAGEPDSFVTVLGRDHPRHRRRRTGPVAGEGPGS